MFDIIFNLIVVVTFLQIFMKSDVGLPAASVTAGEQLHPSGGIMLDDDPHSVKQKSISQINRLIEG